MSNLFHRAARSAGRRLVRAATRAGWYQDCAWELATGRAAGVEAGIGEHQELLAYCTAHAASSYAQLCQDLWVLWEKEGKREGFFVEFGATNGRDINNTCLLEEGYGWNGLLAEPFSRWHAELAANRRARIDHRCVWKESGQQLQFVATPDMPEYGGVEARAFDDGHAAMRAQSSERMLVETVSLNDLLREHGAPSHIDYLSIDTEGSELDILQAFDFGRYRVDLISVEHDYNQAKREALRTLLQAQGYEQRFRRFSSWDDWYVRRDFLELRNGARRPGRARKADQHRGARP
jgi:FkbM family methyltransferase